MTTQHSTGPQHKPVTLLGLGPMGKALAETLLEKGHPLTVWNRSPEKADDLVARGARRARTVAEAVTASPLTLVCLTDYDTMHKVLEPAAEALAGRAVVNLNSGTPAEARAAVRRSEDRGVDYLDGAIMVPPPMVGQPGAVFLYSGSRAVYEQHSEALTSLGDPRYLGDDPGLAVLYNTALLDMMYSTLNGWLHATALVGSANVPAREFAELALGWFMPVVVDYAALARLAPDLDAGHYPGTLSTLVMNLNALDHITRTSEEQGVHSGHPRLMKEIAERAIAEGHGGESYLAVHELFKKATLSKEETSTPLP
ncbi:NAD(P)-dependent oxidoreductase [Streptomyces lavenduligriseus]|uniref:NAD(P)-binding domain-containing protein n=1 Tax=Streptomyces lavenduligriseus TaxID=67315 RepID=A0ABT0NT86_9ACTN|nr:NAD(P)-binding domain-containing protein [Streptomyces lavenduligriseus]MCL3994683.1 NAD(P)-binding domain-containing protein [Streptomyces lavenduligriseus]